HASADEPRGDLVRREVIALYDGAALPEGGSDRDPIWDVWQMPLNHLGLRVRSHDIRRGVPPAEWLPRARAGLTWLQPGPACPDWLWPWLEEQVPAHQLRVLHLESFGCLVADEAGRARMGRWLERFDLAWRDVFVGHRLRVETTLRSKALCALEADPRRHAVHQGPASTDPANDVWVQTRDRTVPNEACAPVVTGAWGGVALAPWTVHMGSQPGSRRWHLDPFAFLSAALGMRGIPAPHPSVLNGRRMFVMHVDGDGFESISTARLSTPAARVFLDEILDGYCIPATVSVIIGSLTKDLNIAEPNDAMKLAAEILNRPYVEAGSHGVLHPYKWGARWAPGRAPLATLPYKGIEGYDYSPVGEVRDSIRFINERLLEGGKRCRIMLWTGDCLPPAEAIRECAKHDCLNMNGGTFRWDVAHDSVGYVSPWVREVDGAVQVCAGAANENEFPGYFTTNPSSFGHIDATIERTGRGRILKPANVYVHFYSAETRPRLVTLKRLLDRWVRSEPTIPVHATVYASAVLGARAAELHRTAEGWSVRAMGDCRTLRIDGEQRDVDIAGSRGVLGSHRIDDALYIHLAGESAEIVLAAEPAARPHLVEANHPVTDVALDKGGAVLSSTAYVPRVIVLGGYAPNAEVRAALDERSEVRKTDEQGRLRLELPAGGPTRIEVRTP
ncbi:MAG: hypothetical protein QNJ90_01725, partial [Planctomycetota bacterium]|nr:hypothetical protein [Planctomycetota bacterium]